MFGPSCGASGSGTAPVADIGSSARIGPAVRSCWTTWPGSSPLQDDGIPGAAEGSLSARSVTGKRVPEFWQTPPGRGRRATTGPSRPSVMAAVVVVAVARSTGSVVKPAGRPASVAWKRSSPQQGATASARTRQDRSPGPPSPQPIRRPEPAAPTSPPTGDGARRRRRRAGDRRDHRGHVVVRRPVVVASAGSDRDRGGEPARLPHRPRHSYCNKFSAYWDAGTATCPSGLRSEEWCADFAAWAWKQAGADFTYGWRPATSTPHRPASTSGPSTTAPGIRPAPATRPGGRRRGLRPRPDHRHRRPCRRRHQLHAGRPGPDVVNGDGDRTGFSVVETGTDQYRADTPGGGSPLSGYASPLTPAG